MTFGDMMAMKRLGETAVSPDGKWLAYSVTTASISTKTPKTAELWLHSRSQAAIQSSWPWLHPGDSGPQSSPLDGKRILAFSLRMKVASSKSLWQTSIPPPAPRRT